MKDFNILAKIMNMLVKDLKKCPEIEGRDGSIIREMWKAYEVNGTRKRV